MLRKPVPTGVVMGALSAHLVRRTLCMTDSGSGVPTSQHDVDAGLLLVPVDLHARGVNAKLGGGSQLGPGAVASNQSNFMCHGE